METIIRKKIDIDLLETIFEKYSHVCYIKHYTCGEHFSNICVRHNEDENPSKLINLAIKEHNKMVKIFDKLETNDIRINEYYADSKHCGYELETYTDCGVSMLLFIDFRDTIFNPNNPNNFITLFKDRVHSIDIDEEIDMHRQDLLFRNNFTIGESLNDFTKWKNKLIKLFK
jgi:hypothetical protein